MADTTEFTTPKEIVIPEDQLPQEMMQEAAAPAPAAQQPLPQAADDPAAGVEALRRQLDAMMADRDRLKFERDDMERRRGEAERQSARDAATVSQHANTVADRDLALTETQIESQSEHLKSLQENAAQALADGDFKRNSELNAQMGRVAARLEQLEAGKQYLKEEAARRAATPAQAPVQQQPAQQPQRPQIEWNRPWNSPVEVEQNVRHFSPASAAWIRQNPQFYTDMNFREQVKQADARARAEGYAADSPQFFRYIESSVNTGGYAPAAPAHVAQAAPTGRVVVQTPAAAPPSRSVPGTTTGGVAITLTAAERQAAHEIMGPLMKPGQDPEVEYAKRLMQIRREGADQQWTARPAG